MNSRDQRAVLTDRSYWDDTWQSVETPKLIDLSDRSLRNHGTIALHDYFDSVLDSLSPRVESLIELGCAQSKWLPYFSNVHKLTVCGIDYSELGCARARELLDRAKCEGEIIHADMFHPPDALRARFDIVLSMGLVEHFGDTASAISACADLAKKGGIIITLIPNLSGLIGFCQRWLDRSVYDKHVPLDREAVAAAHRACGLSILRSDYLLSANFAVLNHPHLRPKIINRLVRGVSIVATGCVWTVECMGINIPPTQFLSPYIACVAMKTDA